MTINEKDNQEDDIVSLTLELRELNIQHNRIQLKRARLRQRIARLSEQNNDDEIVQNQSTTTSNTRSVKLPYLDLTIVSNRKDADGVHLEINDRVEFLSRGEQQSTTGVVRSFSKRFVNAEDAHNRIVRKEPHN